MLYPNTRDNKSFQQIVWAKARLDKSCEINLIYLLNLILHLIIYLHKSRLKKSFEKNIYFLKKRR